MVSGFLLELRLSADVVVCGPMCSDDCMVAMVPFAESLLFGKSGTRRSKQKKKSKRDKSDKAKKGKGGAAGSGGEAGTAQVIAPSRPWLREAPAMKAMKAMKGPAKKRPAASTPSAAASSGSVKKRPAGAQKDDEKKKKQAAEKEAAEKKAAQEAAEKAAALAAEKEAAEEEDGGNEEQPEEEEKVHDKCIDDIADVTFDSVKVEVEDIINSIAPFKTARGWYTYSNEDNSESTTLKLMRRGGEKISTIQIRDESVLSGWSQFTSCRDVQFDDYSADPGHAACGIDPAVIGQRAMAHTLVACVSQMKMTKKQGQKMRDEILIKMGLMEGDSA
eukprot:204091-Pyramimonas_sp.AAC.1